MTPANFDTWLANTQGLGYDADGDLVVGVGGEFHAEWLDRSLYSLAKRTLLAISGQDSEIRFAAQAASAEDSSGKETQRV